MTFWRCRKITDATARPGRRVCALAPAIIAAATLIYATTPAHALLSNGEPAIDILGQFSSVSSDTSPVYTKGCPNNGASALGFDAPTAVLVDTAYHRLFVMDADNDRILVFPLTGTNQISSKTASYVLGQTNFVNCAVNSGALTGFFSDNDPNVDQMAFDPVNNRLFALDYTDSRVFIYNTSAITNGMNATYYLGNGAGLTQAGIFNSTGDGCDFCGGMTYDSTNQLLYVADTFNNRVVIFSVPNGTNVNGENASYVIGQTNFTSGSANEGGSTGQAGLNSPIELALDPANFWLYVADYGNNRIMVFPAYGNASWAGNGENASYVLGQSSFSGNSATTTQSGLNAPFGLAFDSVNNRLFEAEVPPNNRVMIFNTSSLSNGMNASSVIGESSFTAASYTPPVSQSAFNSPFGLSYDSGNSRLYVADETNNRVMEFNVATGATLSSPTQSGFDACAIGGGQLYCWGDNIDGEDGTGNSTTNETPVQIGAATNWTAVSEGDKTFDPAACGIAGGALYCWGENTYGEVGEGNTTPYNTPQQVGSDTTWTVISQSGNDACGIDNGNLYCWGRNEYGELGQGNTIQQTSPVQITSPSETWSTVSTGGTDTCAITTAGALYCWGRNNEGQDGIGSVLPQTTPQQVTSPSATWASISQGSDDTCAITTGGALYCWGYNRYGEDGQGNTTQYSTPQATGTSISTTGWTAVTAQYDGTNDGDACGIAGGALYCWGRNRRGELGIGSTTQTTSPTQVGSSTNWSSVSFGDYDTCGVAGTQLYCWGYNHQYEDGVGNTTENTSPVAVGSGFIGTDENASDELGEYNSPSSTSTVLWTANGANNGPTALGFNEPWAIALDPVNHYFYVLDANNNRVLVYTLNVDNSIPTASGGHTATYVLGQTSLQGANAGGGGMSQLSFPSGIAVDTVNNRLFVTDYYNSRVLVYNVSGGITTGMSASGYLGLGATGQSSMNGPADLAFDSVNERLFVSDINPNRIMVFNVAPGFSNSENASYVLGQPDFNSYNQNQGGSPAQNTLLEPNGLAYDATNNRLFVGDDQQRVMVFNVAPATIANGENASYVLGEPDFVTTSCPGSPQSCTGSAAGLSYDPNNNRLFVSPPYNATVMVFNVGPSQISNGMNASYELGCASFGSDCYGAGQAGFYYSYNLFYDPGSGRLFVVDGGNNRVMIFDATFGSPNFLMMMPD